MNYGNIKPFSTENGMGVRVSLFVSGCRHHCKGCFSSQTWNFDYGTEYTAETEESIIKMLLPPYIDGITILGGEPFEPENQETILCLIQTIKNKCPNKTIWMYSGFQIEEIYNKDSTSRCHSVLAVQIINNIDVLVDGRFKEELKNISLSFRGSENQRVIDVRKTLTYADDSINNVILLEV